MNTMFRKLFFGIFLISINLCAQDFYVNTIYSSSLNKILKLNITNPSEAIEPFCPPTVNTTDIYSDIAIDSSSNMYYITQVGLLYKRNTATSSCSYLGHFSTDPGAYYTTVNSLTADSGNYLYALDGDRILYRYDINTGIFSNLGSLPSSQTSAGDLFFYENRLFLLTTTGLLEVNMLNPSQSCPFMDVNLPNLFAGFSINYGTYSKAYIISGSDFTSTSTMYDVDMENKQINSPIRTFNAIVYGAASIYNLTSTNSSCIPSLSVQENPTNSIQFNVVNPAKNNIICKTNIDRRLITSIRLFDNSGRLIKDFSNQNNIETLNISGISNGTYLLTIGTKKGEMYTKKIIITL